MKAFELEPRYSTTEIAGKCLKCLGEQELNFCLMELLREDHEDDALKERYELIVGFLKSPEFEPLRQQSENMLSEGRRVALRVSHDTVSGKTYYELVEKDTEEE